MYTIMKMHKRLLLFPVLLIISLLTRINVAAYAADKGNVDLVNHFEANLQKLYTRARLLEEKLDNEGQSLRAARTTYLTSSGWQDIPEFFRQNRYRDTQLQRHERSSKASHQLFREAMGRMFYLAKRADLWEVFYIYAGAGANIINGVNIP